MNEEKNKLALKKYLKTKEKELNEQIVKQYGEGENPESELKQLDIIQTIINICESRNKY